MRLCLIVVVLLCAVCPQFARAQTTISSTVTFSHPSLASGQSEIVTVVARDLAGRPLPNASVTIAVRYGSRTVTFHPRHTDGTGRTTLSFHAPPGLTLGKVPVLVTISNGYLRQTVAARFSVSSQAIVPTVTSTVHAPVGPTTTATAAGNGLDVTASALPPTVVAPNPIYVVVNARYHNLDQAGATVALTTSFKEGNVVFNGTTDTYGVATIRIDTARALVTQAVKVVAAVTWKGVTSRRSTVFDVTAARATSTATPVAQASATVMPTWTSTPGIVAAVPIPSPTPADTPTEVPTASPYPTPTVYPTSTPFPTATVYPTPTPVPTDTPIPTSTLAPTPTASPLPTNTATPTPNCPGSQTGCMQAMLNIINTTRAQAGLYPLAMNTVQSNGTTSCAGSYGHSVAMAQSGTIWHTNPAYPAASFPNNDCVPTSAFAENVGQFSSGNELNDLQQIHNLMMNEPHDAATCASQINHACNLLSASLHQVGIGIYFNAGRTWLTEDFLS